MKEVWFFYAVAASMLWGVVYVLDQLVFRYVTPLQFGWMASVATAFLLGAVIWLYDGNTGLAKVYESGPRVWALLAITIVVAVLGTQAIYHSVAASNATLAALVEITYPIFTLLFAWLLLREVQIGMVSALGGVMIIAGVGLVFYGAK